MKKAGIAIFLIVITTVIVLVIIRDYQSGKPGRRGGNIYELDVDRYKAVDPELISHREVTNYKIEAEQVSGLAYAAQKLYVTADTYLQVFDLTGTELMKKKMPEEPGALAVSAEGNIIIAFSNKLGMYDREGKLIWMSDTINQKGLITNLVVDAGEIYAADAGNRQVIRYNMEGRVLNRFEGKSGGADLHGFIIPSANFDLAINADGELWVVNPGKHALENYTRDGQLRGFWDNSSVKVDGFSGCCNPAYIAFLPDGSFVTSEKGLVRIKIHRPSGEFVSVVAAPEKFAEDGKAPNVAVDEQGNIYALDYEQKIIRLFKEM